jgi:uncharacterized coiled-coil protein SlyX
VNQKTVAGVVMVIALVVWGALVLFLPGLQSADLTSAAKASEHVERARRYLHGYNATVAHTASLLDQMRELSDLGVDVDGEDVEGLLEAAEDAYQEEYTYTWENHHPGGSPSFANAAAQIERGLRSRDDLLDGNDALLSKALREIDLAIREFPANTEAHRLKGVVLHQQGLADLRQAHVIASEGGALRRELAALALEIRQLERARTRVADSGIEERIRELKAKISETEARVAVDREALAGLDQTVAQHRRTLEAARKDAANTREAMDELKARGIDFSDPDGAADFARRYHEADRSYREALRRAHALEFGTYPNARLGGSGDFLSGRYVEAGTSETPSIAYGLRHHLNDRAVLALRVQGAEDACLALRSDMVRLEKTGEQYALKQERALQRTGDVQAEAEAAYDELAGIVAEAEELADQAIASFEKAVDASEKAARQADGWIRAARDRASNLSSSARDVSAHESRTKDTWITAASLAQIADAQLAIAWAYYGQYQGRAENHALLSNAARVLGLTEADPDGEQEAAEQARGAGIAAVQAAMEALARAHRDAGRHWTLAAQAAGTTYLMVLFGHEDYTRDVVEGYRKALEGREDESYTAKLAARLKRLQKRR